MKPDNKDIVFVLTKSDCDRIQAAIGLMRQITRDIISKRRVRINSDVHTPGALYELEQEARYIRAVLDGDSPDYDDRQLNFDGI